MTGIERLRKLTDATLGYVRVASVTPHDYEYENDVEWDERTRLSELLASIYSQINREQDAMVADSPYEALPPEEREAIAWVRNHGGLDHVKAEWRSRVPFEKHEKRRQRLLGHIAECEAALGRRRRSIEKLEGRVKALTNENAELRRRAMPEGCEWPRYDTGEPVRIGDVVSDVEVRSVVFRDGGILLSDCTSVPGWGTWRSYKEPIKRPAVIAADGEPLEVGQTVWEVETGDGYVVDRIYSGTTEPDFPGHTVACCRPDDIVTHMFKPSDLTHQRPVLDADGVPIKKGDTVYLLPGEWCDEFPCLGFHGGDELEVFDDEEAVHVSGGVQCREKEKKVGFRGYCYPQPSQLTHTKPEPPDSAERIADEIDRLREEVALHLGDYLYDEDGNDSIQFSMELVAKRCRALAERERGD